MGRAAHVGAVEVGHSVVVDVGIACRRGQMQHPAGRRPGRVRDGRVGTVSWENKETGNKLGHFVER